MKNLVISVIGPTAVGKTSLGVKIANKYNGEIISADSRQVYKGMDIGTGKDLNEYIVEGKRIPAHLIDIVSPQDEFNLFMFLTEFNKAIKKIEDAGKLPVLVGGTGLFLHAVFNRYKLNKAEFDQTKIDKLKKLADDELRKRLIDLAPHQHNTTDLLERERIIKAILIAEAANADFIEPPALNFVNLCILPDRKIIRKRIDARLNKRLQNGMVEEVERLIEQGVSYERLEKFGLEYRYIALYLQGKLNYNDMRQKLASAIKRFAKRQITWIRKFEKEGIIIHYLDSPDFEKAEKIIDSELQLS